MKELYYFIFLFLWSVVVSAQVIPISNGSIYTCSGLFTDSGLENGAYSSNENQTFTICPGSQGGNIRLSFTEAAFRPGDVLCFYDGTSNNEPLISCSSNFNTEEFVVQATNQTGCLTAVFVSNAYQQDEGWQATISCSPNCQEITAQLVSSSPTIDNNNINICAGTAVALNASALFPNNNQQYQQDIANCTFKWGFGNGATAEGQNINYLFPQGGGSAVTLLVTDQYGCESKNSIGLNMRIAEQPSFSFPAGFAPDICVNKTLNLSASVSDTQADILIHQPGSDFSMVKSLSDSLALPDGTGASYVSNIFYNEFNTGQTLSNAAALKNIFINMEHSWLRDIQITIECPNGQSAVLSHHPGNTGGEVFLGEPNELDEGLSYPVPGIGYNYQWSTNASNPNWIEYINNNHPSVLPAGDYTPYQSFDQLVGCPLNGNWQLEVIDSWASDNGFIFGWGLEFDESIYPEGETYTPLINDIQWIDNKLVTFNNGDNIDLLSKSAGKKTFQVQATNDFGCVADTQYVVNVLPATSPLCYDCADFKMKLPDTAICLGQTIDYNASFDKTQIKTLAFEAFENKTIEVDFVSRLTVTNVNPGQIGSVSYRINSIDFMIHSDAPTNFDVYIESPSGKKLILATNISISGTAAHAFEPNNTSIEWSKLQGEYINGDWKLFAQAANNTSAILVSWGITFKNDVSVGYHWTGNGLSCTDCPTPAVSPTQSGDFIVEVYDNLNCSYTDTAHITIIGALSPPTINDPTSENGQITFTWLPVSNASGYLVKINNSNWITPNGILSQTLDGYVLGDEISFSVKALSAGGCDGSDAHVQHKITNCLLTSSHTVTQAPACVGINDGAIQVIATNGTPTIQFRLDGGSPNTSGLFQNMSAGNHFVIVSDQGGCFDTLVFTIDPAKQLVLDIESTDVTCFGAGNGVATANLNGGASMPINYIWSNGGNNQSINGLSQGIYSVIATDNDGCQLSQNTNIATPDALALNFTNSQNVSCFGLVDGGTETTITGGTIPYSYLWSSGETTASIMNKPFGNYALTVTDAMNCTATSNIQITQPFSELVVSANQTVTGCSHTNNNKALATAAGGVAPYDYQWSNAQNNPLANNLPPGNYSVTATDKNGCSASTALSIAEHESVVATLSFVEPKCNGGNDGSVTVTNITGGNSNNLADYTYQWLGQLDTDKTIEQLAGDKSYYVTVTGTSGCVGVEGIFVTEPDPIELELTSTPVTCAGDQDGKAEVLSITGNVGPYDIQWAANAHHATTEEVLNLSGDLYHVTVTNPYGCTGTNYIQVKEAQLFEIENLSTRDPNCAFEENGDANITLTGGAHPFQFQWSNGSLENSISYVSSGDYEVTITDAHNCILLDTAVLVEPTPITATSYAVAPNCHGENSGSITVNAAGGTGAFSYSLNNVSFESNNILEDMVAGSYALYIKDDHECLHIDTVTVIQPPAFSLDAGPDLHLAYGELTDISIEVNNAQGDINVLVVNPLGESTTCVGCYDLTIDPKYHGEYSIVATDENGCMTTDIIEILVEKNEQFLVPTAFTPNSDNINDYLTCHTKHEAQVVFFRVYDRWGGLIFESKSGVTNQPKQGWDGSSRGKKMPAGTYIWTAQVKFNNGIIESFKGQTNIIR